MSDFQIIHKPYRPQPVYTRQRKELMNPMVDLAIIVGLVIVLLLTGYTHL